MVNPERIRQEFQRLVAFDSESYSEGPIKEYLKERLAALGLSVYEDDAGSRLGQETSQSAGNLYALLPGNATGDGVLFSAHMDTVSPGLGKKAVFHPDGRITSDGSTVLGADDISGIVSILEALAVLQEEHLPHPDIEVLLTVAEEPYCKGASVFDFSRIRSRLAYVLDLTGPIGTAATCAPSILSVEILLEGKAAHAGFAPEEGVNALTAAVQALSRLPTGHISPDTTVNFGRIRGGSGRNIVPARIEISGEIRSLRPEAADAAARHIREVFAEEAAGLQAKVDVTVTEEIRAYRIDSEEPVVQRFAAALERLRYGPPKLITTFGGSDNNWLNQKGIRGIVIANAMENTHTRQEYTTLSELVRSATLTQTLMTL